MDLEALVTDELREEIAGYALESYELEAGDAAASRARASRAACPSGEIARGDRSAATARSTRCSRRSTPPPGSTRRLREFRIDAVTEGQDALGEVSVVVELAGQTGVRAGRRDGHHRGRRPRLPARADDARSAREAGRRAARRRGAADAAAIGGRSDRSSVVSSVITYDRMAIAGEPRAIRYDADRRSAPRVRALREAMGLSLRELALRCGVSAPMLSQVERGETSPTLQVAARIAAGLDLRLSQLLRLDEDGSVTIVRAGRAPARRQRAARAPLRGADRRRSPGSGSSSPSTRWRRAPSPAAPDDPPMHEPGSREIALVEAGAVTLHCDGAPLRARAPATA